MSVVLPEGVNPFLDFNQPVNCPAQARKFDTGRSEPRVYLQRENCESNEEVVDGVVQTIRSYLGGEGFIGKTHDQEATVYRNGDNQIMLHQWRGALKEHEGLPLRRKWKLASRVSPDDIDTMGWTIAIKGDCEICQGIAAYMESEFTGITPIQTSYGNTVYSVSYPVLQEIKLSLPTWAMGCFSRQEPVPAF